MELKDRIGRGARREVYPHPDNPEWVIKRVRPDRPKAKDKNRREWEVWSLAKQIKQHDLLVPCISISECGTYLTQIKGEQITTKRHLPVKVYTWMAFDADSPRQWVKINGKILLCDYDSQQLAHLKEIINEKSPSE